MEMNTVLLTQKDHKGFILIICIYFLDVQYNAFCDSYNCVESRSCIDLDNCRFSGTLFDGGETNNIATNNDCSHLDCVDRVNQCEPLSWANTCFVVYRFGTCPYIYIFDCFDGHCTVIKCNLEHGATIKCEVICPLDPNCNGVFCNKDEVHSYGAKVYYKVCCYGRVIGYAFKMAYFELRIF